MESQLSQTCTIFSSSLDTDNEMTRLLLERTESMTQTLKEVQDFLRSEKQSAEAHGSQATALQENIASVETEMDTFDDRATELEGSHPSTQEEILSTLMKMQENLENINTCMRSSAKASEETLQQLLRPRLENVSTASLVSPGTSQNSQLQQQQMSNLGSVISIQSTAIIGTQRRCKRYCGCSCHGKSTLTTSGFLSRVVGKLFVSYNSIPIWKPRSCNSQQCVRRTADRIQVNYMFPRWMLQTCISLSLSWNSGLFHGASSHLSMPRFNPDWKNVVAVIQTGDIMAVRRFLDIQKILLTDIDENGTILLVRRF